QAFLQELKQVQKITPEKFREIMKSVQKSTGIRGKELWMPIRVALTGRPHGPELPVVAELLGYDKCCKFVQKALSET
ncbi:glutamate--tRNA ligase, partial [candidate division KSB1 bacterium]